MFVFSGVPGFSFNFDMLSKTSDSICCPDEPALELSIKVVIRSAQVMPCFCQNQLNIWQLDQQHLITNFMSMIFFGWELLVDSDSVPVIWKINKKLVIGSFFENTPTIDGLTFSVVVWFDN